MTAQATIRAALEKHGISFNNDPLIDWPVCEPAILEAMQQHRAEALEEVEKWVDSHSNTIHAGQPVVYRTDLKAKLKSLRAGGE